MRDEDWLDFGIALFLVLVGIAMALSWGNLPHQRCQSSSACICVRDDVPCWDQP